MSNQSVQRVQSAAEEAHRRPGARSQSAPEGQPAEDSLVAWVQRSPLVGSGINLKRRKPKPRQVRF